MFSPTFLTSKENVDSSPTCQGPSLPFGEKHQYSNKADSSENDTDIESVEELSILCPVAEHINSPGLKVMAAFSVIESNAETC